MKLNKLSIVFYMLWFANFFKLRIINLCVFVGYANTHPHQENGFSTSKIFIDINNIPIHYEMGVQNIHL